MQALIFLQLGIAIADIVRYCSPVVGKQEVKEMLDKVRWFPPNATAVGLPGVDAVAYVDGLTAIGYAGKRGRPEFRYRFASEAARVPGEQEGMG
jgi:hypothetical protein